MINLEQRGSLFLKNKVLFCIIPGNDQVLSQALYSRITPCSAGVDVGRYVSNGIPKIEQELHTSALPP